MDLKSEVAARQRQILAQLVECEEAFAELYNIYAALLPQHAEFWSTLVHEEVAHATTLKTLYSLLDRGALFHQIGRFSDAITQPILDRVRREIQEATPSQCTPEYALRVAWEIENSLGESGFYDVVESDAPEFRAVAALLSKALDAHINKIQAERVRRPAG